MAARRSAKNPAKLRPAKVRRKPLSAVVLPDAAVTDCTVRLLGTQCALVENHGGIVVLRQDRVSVRTKCGLLSISGRNLTLSEVRPDAMVVNGQIEGISCPAQGNA